MVGGWIEEMVDGIQVQREQCGFTMLSVGEGCSRTCRWRLQLRKQSFFTPVSTPPGTLAYSSSHNTREQCLPAMHTACYKTENSTLMNQLITACSNSFIRFVRWRLRPRLIIQLYNCKFTWCIKSTWTIPKWFVIINYKQQFGWCFNDNKGSHQCDLTHY